MNLLNLNGGNEELFNEYNNYGFNFKLFNIIRTSLKLEIYDSLKSKKTLAELSKELDIKNNKLESFLDVLIQLKYVNLENGFYQNTEISEVFLTSDSLYSIKDYFFTMSRFSAMWYNLDTTLKNDIVLKDTNVFVNVVNGMGYECLLGELDKTINIISRYEQFKNAKKSLDIGGGHGLYSIAMEKFNENLQAYVFDLKPVLENTEKFIEKFNSNVKTIAGDFNTDEFGDGFDVIFSSYNPGGKNPKIAKKVYDSLNTNGLFITKQCFNNEKNIKSEKNLKSTIDRLEWNFSHLNDNDTKNKNLYSFKGDLNFNAYVDYLKDLGFTILNIYSQESFSNKISGQCNAYMIIAEKI